MAVPSRAALPSGRSTPRS